MDASDQHTKAERMYVCWNHPYFVVVLVSPVCRALVFLLLSSTCPPFGCHLHPLLGSTLPHLKGWAPSLAVPLHSFAWWGHSHVDLPLPLWLWKGNICLALCSQRPFSLSLYQYPGLLPESLPKTCPLVVTWHKDASCWFLPLPMHSPWDRAPGQ